MKPITIVIATQEKNIHEFKQNCPIYESLFKQMALKDLFTQNTLDYKIVYNNTKGLSKLYNEFLDDNEYKDHILLFVHDDVVLEDIFLVEKLQKSPYTVTGLAGCKQADVNKQPAWHLMSERNTYVGEVAHIKENKVWTTVFGETNSRALLIDGLFISVNVEEANKKKIRFDEDFTFHHYDLAFCLICNTQKASVGVLPIRVIHYGLGDSMNTSEWRSSAVKFSKKYGNNTFR
jgi:hypothetical protein